jgi:excisionase family DNA binding protein
VREYAEVLRVTPKTLRAWALEGRIARPIRVGRRMVFLLQDVEAHLASQGAAAAQGVGA